MKIGFLFAGQGSQFVGMGKDFYEKYDLAKKYFDIADNIIQDLKKVCFEGPADELKLTKYTQPAIFVMSAIINDIIKEEKGISPEAVAGFSLGEYTALYSAGCFDLEAGLKLVAIRGNAMTEASERNPGTMAAIIGLDDKIVEEVCEEITNEGEIVVPVNYNCPGQLVISGVKGGIEKAVELLKAKGAKRAVILPVSGAFHSPLMEPAVGKLKEALDTIEIREPGIPIIFNATAEPESNSEKIKELMLKQLVSPVLWKHTIAKLVDIGIDTFIEVGPGRVLSGFMRNIDRNLQVKNIQKIDDIEKI